MTDRVENLDPVEPEDAGVAKKTPELAQTEGAHLLARNAKPLLEGRGFTEDQIDRWAQTYVSEEGSGDVDRFIAWIDARQD